MANTTWNPSDRDSHATLSGSNLVVTGAAGLVSAGVRAVDRQLNGKFYWECTYNVTTASTTGVGLASQALSLSLVPANANAIGACLIIKAGTVYADGAIVPGGNALLGAAVNGTVVCLACDFGAQRIWFRYGAAGNWNGSAAINPATGAGGLSTGTLGSGIPVYAAAWVAAVGDQITANFGDTAFVGTPPSGFTAGFTAGATIPTNTIVTQLAAEQWASGTPDLQLTQIALEQWAQVNSAGVQMALTQLALEHWASVANVPVSVGAPIITMIG